MRYFYLALAAFCFYMAYATIANATPVPDTGLAKDSQKAEEWEAYRTAQVCNEEGVKRLKKIVRYSNALWEAQMANDKLHECKKFLRKKIYDNR